MRKKKRSHSTWQKLDIVVEVTLADWRYPFDDEAENLYKKQGRITTTELKKFFKEIIKKKFTYLEVKSVTLEDGDIAVPSEFNKK